MSIGPLEEIQKRNNEIKLVTAALFEAKVEDGEILRVLMKVCDIEREKAMTALQKEKFMKRRRDGSCVALRSRYKMLNS